MTVIKQYNTGTSVWEPIVSGVQGPTGPTGPTGATGATGIPTGAMEMFAGAITQTVSAGVVTTTAPTGWLLCNGDAVSRSTYSTLFTAISTTFGAGDNSTTFNIPDMRSRMPIGVGTGTGLTARTLAGTGGVETVILTSAQSGVPAHSHTNTLTNNAVTTGTGSAHSHASTASFSGSFSGNAASHNHTQSAHQHVMNYADNGSIGSTRSTLNAAQTTGTDAGQMQSATPAIQSTSITPSGSISGSVTMSNPSESSHTHSVTSNVTISNVANTAATAASAHDNMSPYLGVNFIIKI